MPDTNIIWRWRSLYERLLVTGCSERFAMYHAAHLTWCALHPQGEQS